MTLHTDDQATSSQNRGATAPNYWLGLLLTFFFPGSGFAYINRLWPTVAFCVFGNLFVGPLAIKIFSKSFSNIAGLVFIALYILHFFWYRNAYQDQYKLMKVSLPQLPVALRYMGVWMSAIFFLIQTAIRMMS